MLVPWVLPPTLQFPSLLCQFPLLGRSFWVWRNPICLFSFLLPVLLESYWETLPVLHLGLWFILSWFLYVVRDRGCNLILQHMYIQVFLISFLQCIPVVPRLVDLFLRFLFLFHWYRCCFLCQYHAVLVTIALYFVLKSVIVRPVALSHSLRIALTLGSFKFP
jgi:hypothetical protein